MHSWEQISAKLETFNDVVYTNCEDDYCSFILILRFINGKTITNEIERMPFVEDIDFAMFRGIGFYVVEILNITRGVFCEFVNNKIYQKNKITNETCIYYQTLRAAFESCYPPSGFIGSKTEYNANGKINLINHYHADGQTRIQQDFIVSDAILQQQFCNRKFHGLQFCKWNNGGFASIVYENGSKNGPFFYKYQNKMIIGKFEKNVPIDFCYYTLDRITALNNVVVPSNLHWTFIAENILLKI